MALPAPAVSVVAEPGAALLENVVVAGRRVHALYRIDRSEQERRRSQGLAAVTDRRLLEVLAGIPAGDELPWSAIDPTDAIVLGSAPAGVIVASDVGIKRLFVPALEVDYVIANESRPRRAIEEVSLFAAVAERVAVSSSFDACDLELAARLGVGCITVSRGAARLALEPTRSRVRPGPMRWWLGESILDELVRRASAPAATT